ncbi:hypothetical protein C9927_01800 [Pseudidiomarina aestuarii]|uniref:Uncharacterized protein n=1 Tax=Pseudidiomarina aestuarii TaxID=624146 RepID=A0A2T4D6N3_9GAMM|nr:hypothetical protein C9927_01800 [Pseudidiomarina aestuarii]
MNIIIRMLIVLLVLGSLGTPASARVSDDSMSASNVPAMQHHMAADADADHSCCDDETNASEIVAIQHMDCDNTCSDCQHHCAGSASALTQSAFTFPSTLPAQILRDDGTVITALPGYLDRPPMA